MRNIRKIGEEEEVKSSSRRWLYAKKFMRVFRETNFRNLSKLETKIRNLGIIIRNLNKLKFTNLNYFQNKLASSLNVNK